MGFLPASTGKASKRVTRSLVVLLVTLLLLKHFSQVKLNSIALNGVTELIVNLCQAPGSPGLRNNFSTLLTLKSLCGEILQ